MMGAAGALCCLLAGTAAGSWLRDRRLRRLRTLRARLDVVAARLAPYRYVRCHQSYLANLRHVRQLNKVTHQLTLSSGATIPISKQYYAQVIECLRADRA